MLPRGDEAALNLPYAVIIKIGTKKLQIYWGWTEHSKRFKKVLSWPSKQNHLGIH